MKSLNNEVEKAVNEVIEALNQDDRILMYRQVNQMIQADGSLHALWESQKEIQKELVHAKTYHLPQQKEKLEHELETIEKQLSTHPLMQAYKEAHVYIVEIQKEIEEIVFGE